MTDIVARCMNPSIDISTSVERVMPIRKLRFTRTRALGVGTLEYPFAGKKKKKVA